MPIIKFITVFLTALLILVLIAGLRLGTRRLSRFYPRWKFKNSWLVFFEFIVWMGFIFWSIRYLFSEKFYFHYLVFGIIFVVFAFFSWFLFSDILAGIVFKIKHNLKTGSHISAGGFTGKITSQRLTYLKLKTEEGSVLRIPYSKINHAVISEMTHTEALKEHAIQLEISTETSKSDAETLIREAILNTPWSNITEEPSIKHLSENDKNHTFEIMLFTTNLKHMKFIEMALEKIPKARVIS